MQLALLSLKNKYSKEETGIKFDENVKASDVINTLPYNLTKAQKKVLEEIEHDMESTKPMNRLLQGDVGSGKTVDSVGSVATVLSVVTEVDSVATDDSDVVEDSMGHIVPSLQHSGGCNLPFLSKSSIVASCSGEPV